jgi:hypothetical protein
MNHRAQRLGLFSAVGETCSPLMPRHGQERQCPLRCQPSWASGVYNHENPQSCLHPRVLGGLLLGTRAAVFFRVRREGHSALTRPLLSCEGASVGSAGMPGNSM